MCPGEQLYNTEVQRTEKYLAIQTLALSSRSAEFCRTRQTQLWNRLMNIFMFGVAVMVGFTVQREVCTAHKAVTGGSKSSLGHLMMSSGEQIF